jgi:hypothetical protein
MKEECLEEGVDTVRVMVTVGAWLCDGMLVWLQPCDWRGTGVCAGAFGAGLGTWTGPWVGLPQDVRAVRSGLACRPVLSCLGAGRGRSAAVG